VCCVCVLWMWCKRYLSLVHVSWVEEQIQHVLFKEERKREGKREGSHTLNDFHDILVFFTVLVLF